MKKDLEKGIEGLELARFGLDFPTKSSHFITMMASSWSKVLTQGKKKITFCSSFLLMPGMGSQTDDAEKRKKKQT